MKQLFTAPKVGMDITYSVGSDVYSMRITAVDANGKGFTAAPYRPINKAVWPAQDWQFEDENGHPLLADVEIHFKYSYGCWRRDYHHNIIGGRPEPIYLSFGHRGYHQDPSF